MFLFSLKVIANEKKMNPFTFIFIQKYEKE